MTKHTPGRWTVDDTDVPFVINAGDDGQMYVATIASTEDYHGPETDTEAQANARLIAAAPEMHAQLAAILAAWDADWIRTVDHNANPNRSLLSETRDLLARIDCSFRRHR